MIRNLELDPIILGGQGVICQIDKSLFCHKQKNYVGKISDTQMWIFGIVNTSFCPAKRYMEIALSRSSGALLQIIERVRKPGTEIHSNEWASYRILNIKTRLVHKTVNHSVKFVNPINGTHTQHIESYWQGKSTK